MKTFISLTAIFGLALFMACGGDDNDNDNNNDNESALDCSEMPSDECKAACNCCMDFLEWTKANSDNPLAQGISDKTCLGLKQADANSCNSQKTSWKAMESSAGEDWDCD